MASGTAVMERNPSLDEISVAMSHQSVAMELLVQCGLKEQLFDLAKVSA